jgi:hypothetical protein
LVGEFFEVRTQVDHYLTTVSRVDRRLGLIKNLGRHTNGTGLQLRHLQGGHDAKAPLSHAQRRTRSSPESPARRTKRCIAMMPPAGRATPKSAATMPTDKRVSGGFRPNSHHARRTHAAKVASNTPTPLQHLHRMRPDAVENTTSHLQHVSASP